jgi:hypothetical protein
MMLYKSEDAVKKILESENRELFSNVYCWIREEDEYNLHVFSILLENESELEKVWNELTNAIAVFFQSELDNDIEIWNIYIMFLVKDFVSRDLKYKIEQEKYSARKIVVDNFRNNDYCLTNNIESLIESRLFIFNLPDSNNNEVDEFKDKSIDEVDNPETLINNSHEANNTTSLVTVLEQENFKLYEILTQHANDKPLNKFVKYLG